MYVLGNTTSLLRLTTNGDGDITTHASWVDHDEDGGYGGSLNAVGTVENVTFPIVPPPAADTERQVKAVVVRNNHATNAYSVTVEHYDGTLYTTVLSVTLGPKEWAEYLSGTGWTVYTASGQKKAHTTQTVDGTAGGDLTGTYPNPTIKPSVALTGEPTAPDPDPGNGDGIVNVDFLGEQIGFFFNNTIVPALAGKQNSDAMLSALAALTSAANKGLYFTGADAVALYDLTAFGRSVGGVADAAALKALLSLGITDVSGLQAALDAKVPASRLLTAGYGLADLGDLSADRTPRVALSTATNDLASNVAMASANTFYTGPQLINLPAGTWFVVATLTVGREATTITGYSGRITDGAAHYASTSASHPSQNPHVVSMTMAAFINLVGATTIMAQAAATSAGSIIYAAAPSNGSGNHASHIRAIRVA